MIGLFLLGKAVVLTKEYLKFGVIEYVMDPYPGAVGGQIGGWMDLSRNFDFNADYQVELTCIFSYMSGTGDDRTRREIIKWSQKGTAQKAYNYNRMRISFVFDIPNDLPESDIDQTEDYYFWRLGLKAQMSGTDLNRIYNIPVIKTGRKSTIKAVNITKQMKQAKIKAARQTRLNLDQGKFNLTELAKTVKITDTPLKLELYFPMLGNKILTLFCFIFGTCFSAVSYGLIRSIDHFGFVDIVMGIIAFPFACSAVFCMIATFNLIFHNLKVTFTRHQIHIRHRLFFIPVWYCFVDYKDVKTLKVKRSGSTGQGTGKTEHFKIIAQTRQNKKLTLARNINGKETAASVKDWLLDRILGK